MQRVTALAVGLSLAASLTWTATSAQAQTVEIANGQWKPYLGEELPGGGPVGEAVRAAFETQGWEVNYHYLPWARGREQAADGELDGTIVWSRNAEREKNFHFAGPVLQLHTVFFHRAGDGFSWSEPADLEGMTIGGIVDYDYGPFTRGDAAERFDVERASSLELNFRKLLKGRVDVVAEERNVGRATLAEMELTDEVAMDSTPIKTADYYMMVGKAGDRAAEIVEVFEAGMQEIRENGRYDEILGDLGGSGA